MISESIKEVLNNILQSQTAASEFDVVAIINHWTSMIGDHTDFVQFRKQFPFDKLNPEQKQLAFEMLQQAAEAEEQAKNP